MQLPTIKGDIRAEPQFLKRIEENDTRNQMLKYIVPGMNSFPMKSSINKENTMYLQKLRFKQKIPDTQTDAQ